MGFDFETSIIILDISVIVSLILTVLFGFIKGFPKACNRLLIVLVSVIIFMFMLKPLTNVLMTTKFSESFMDRIVSITGSSLEDYGIEAKNGGYIIKDVVEEIVKKTIYNNNPEYSSSSELASLVSSASSMIVRSIVYVVGLILLGIIQMILSIIFFIIRRIAGIRLKKGRAKLFGALASVATFVIMFTITYLPLYGTLTFSKQIFEDIKKGTSLEKENKETADLIDQVIEATDDSIIVNYVLDPLSKIFYKDKGHVETRYLGEVLSFEYNKEKINICKEYDNISQAVPTIIKIYQLSNGNNVVINLEEYTDSDIDSISNVFSKSRLLRISMPALVEYISFSMEKNSSVEIKDIVTSLKGINWEEELDSFASAINVFKNHHHVYIDTSDLSYIYNSKTNVLFLEDLTARLINMQLVYKVAMPYAVEKLDEYLKKNVSSDFDLSSLKEVNWKDDGASLFNFVFSSYKLILDLDVDMNNFEAILKKPELINTVDSIFTNLASVDVFNEKVLPAVMDYLIIKVENNEKLKNFNFNYENIKNTNWKDEIASVKNILKEIINAYQELNFDKDNWQRILKNNELETYATNIVNALLSSNLIEKEIIPCLANEISFLVEKNKDNIPFDTRVILNICEKDNIKNLLQNDIGKVISILRDLNTIGVLNNQKMDLNDTVTQKRLVNIIETIFTLSTIKGNEKEILTSILDMANINETLQENGIVLNFDGEIDWEKEGKRIGIIFKNILELTGGLENFDLVSIITDTKETEKREKVADIIATFAESNIFKDSIYNLIDVLTTNVSPDYQVTFSEEEKKAIETNGFKNEVLILFEIIDDAQNYLEGKTDIATLDEEMLKKIMLKASEGVIASKVLGTALNTALGDKVTFDLRTRENMANCAEMVYSAIKLAKTVNRASSIDLSDTNEINSLVESIAGLSKSDETVELANQLISNVLSLDESLELTKEDIQDASSKVKDVCKKYQESSDKENFNLEKYKESLSEEDKKDFEGSKLAELILNIFFN